MKQSTKLRLFDTKKKEKNYKYKEYFPNLFASADADFIEILYSLKCISRIHPYVLPDLPVTPEPFPREAVKSNGPSNA